MKQKKLFKTAISRIVIVIILLVLPINIMTLVLSNMVLSDSRAQITREVSNTLETNGDIVEDLLTRSVKRMFYMSQKDEDFVRLSALNGETVENSVNEYESGLLINARQRLNEVRMEFPYIDLLYFYFPHKDFTIISGHPGPDIPDCRELIAASAQEKERENSQWAVMDMDGTSILFNSIMWNNTVCGSMINLEWLLERLNLDGQYDGRTIFFTNGKEDLYTSGGGLFFEEEGKSLEEMKEMDRFEIFTQDLEDFDLKLVEIIDWDQQARNLPLIIYALQFFSVVMTLAVIPVLLLYIRHSISKPLNRLIKAMDRVKQGDWDYRVTTQKQGREFEQLNGYFNDMMNEVKHLKISVYEKELERKDIKMRYLSSQIQPHFIMNALNIIYSYKPEEYPLIRKMVLCISKYLRYIVKVNEKYVELFQEMNHIKNYFEIQKARYPGMFFYIVEYDETLENALIPPLLIQNFAENAIKYSLKAGDKVTILIVAEKTTVHDTQFLRIRIADTGRGISDEILDKIRIFQETGVMQEGLGVGVQNSIERLKYLYSDQARIRFWKDENYQGTNVEIMLPLHFSQALSGDYPDASMPGFAGPF